MTQDIKSDGSKNRSPDFENPGQDHATNSQKYSELIRRKVVIKALHGQHRFAIANSLNIGGGYVEQVISNTKGLVLWRKHLRYADKLKNAINTLTVAIKENPQWLRKDLKAHYSSPFFYALSP